MELLLVSLVKELLLEEERERDLRWRENGCGKRKVEPLRSWDWREVGRVERS